MSLNPEFKAKWLAALRGDAYTQGQQQLHPGLAFCCLGVACDISGRGMWDGDSYYVLPEIDEFGLPISGLDCLPKILRKEIGLTSEEESELATMNDNGKTFPEIADWIEQNL